MKFNSSSHLFMDILTILVGGPPFQDSWPLHVRNMYSKYFFHSSLFTFNFHNSVIYEQKFLILIFNFYQFFFSLVPYLRNLCQFYDQKTCIFFKYLQFIVLYFIFVPWCIGFSIFSLCVCCGIKYLCLNMDL